MKASEIRVGRFYRAKVGVNIITVRVDRTSEVMDHNGRVGVQYNVTNLATGRKAVFNSATKFKYEITGDESTMSKVEGKQGSDPSTLVNARSVIPNVTTTSANVVQSSLEKETLNSPAIEYCTNEEPDCCEGDRSGDGICSACGKPIEGEQRADPPESRAVATIPVAPTVTATVSTPPSETVEKKRPFPAGIGLASRLSALPASTGGSSDNAPHLIVSARAGTGKTTTLIEGIKSMRGYGTSITPSDQQRAIWDSLALSKGAGSICMVAFNKSIATELQNRVPPGVVAMTMHSMGYKAVQAAFGRQAPESYVVMDYTCELLGIDPDDRREKKRKWDTLVAVEKLVSLCKMNLIAQKDVKKEYGYASSIIAIEDEVLDDLVDYYDIELNSSREEVFRLVPEVLMKCLDPRGKITFDDMIWLPITHNLSLMKYDLLLVDECVPSWTPVMLSDGTSLTIKEIVDTKKELMVRSYDTVTGKEKNCRVTGWHKILNQKPLVKVKVKHHHRTGTNRKCNFVICTVDHKVWTLSRGWVPAGELRIGDDVVIETSAKKSQKGKVTTVGRDNLAKLQKGNKRGLGNSGGDPERFNRNKGGNGRGLTLTERVLLEELGEGWESNYTVLTGDAPNFGRGDKPAHYKIDIANPNAMIAVEVDGSSHRGRKDQDDRKQKFLESKGWRVVRVSNRDAIQQTPVVVDSILYPVVVDGDNTDCPRPASVVSVSSVRIPDSYVYDITVEDCHNFYANGVLVHNCQDLNRCQQALAKKAGDRLVFVGDEKQAIYGFAGADCDSIKRLKGELEATPRGCTVLPLTVTRRCGRAIVEEARKIVPDFSAHESNPDGLITEGNYPETPAGRKLEWEESYSSMVKSGDFILCRVNAPLVSQCFRFLKRGIKATIQGRDVGAGLISAIKKVCGKDMDLQRVHITDLITNLDIWSRREQAKESAKRNPSESRLIALQDRYDCLMCFAEDAETAGDVVGKIQSIFTDNKNEPGIRLSSIHKAKGLESERVFFLMPKGSGTPHPMAKDGWQMEQEWNLFYVAVTRAIRELCYVR